MPGRRFALSCLMVVVCGLLSAPQPPSAQTHGRTQARGERGTGAKATHVPGEILVRFRSTAKPSIEAAHRSLGAEMVREFAVVDGLQLVKLPADTRVEQALAFYRANPAVLYAEPNYIYQPLQSVIPNDPNFPDMWGLHNTGQMGGRPDADIDAPEAWGITTGDANVVIGVIDTGIDYNHPDLNPNMFRNTAECTPNGADDDGNGFVDDCFGIDTANHDGDPMDDVGHGTHVAGTIGAVGSNGIGVTGVNWNVRLMACKFLGQFGGSTAGAITCLEYFAAMKDRGVNLVATNNSWGGGPFSQALLDAIDSHRPRGILFIAAAGNAGANNDEVANFPSNFYLPHIIAVAATDRGGVRARFSNFGRRTVHLRAPGEDVLSTIPRGGYDFNSGTSMAAPHVTGVAALLAAQDPSRDWKTIKNLLLAGGSTTGTSAESITAHDLNALGAMTCSNSMLLSRLQPVPSFTTAAVGVPLNLAMLHINCGAPNGPLQVVVDGGAQSIALLDDGLGFDQEAGDGIYSAQWVPAAMGTHTLSFPDGTIQVTVVQAYRPASLVPFNYRNIVGTPLNLFDDTSTLIMPPFPVQFGGGNFISLNVNSNGNITFGTSFISPVNTRLPAMTMPSNLVAAFWDDLWMNTVATPGQDVFWDVIGTAPNRELVIEWRNVEHFDCIGPTIRFQVVFFEGQSNILFNYADAQFDTSDPFCSLANMGGSATVGVQVAPGVASQFSFGTQSINNNTSLLFTLGPLTPSLTRLSPFDAVAGDPAFTLRVIGKDFVSTSVVRWNGVDLPTTFVDSTELAASISAADIAAAGTAQVTVFTAPPNGGGESGPLPFQIVASRAQPTLASVTPTTLLSGAPGATLTASGSGFHSASVLRWKGADRPTTVTNSTTLTASISASDLAVLGPAAVTIFNPPLGGGESNALTVNVNNPSPVPVFILPDTVAVGGPNFTLSVLGFGFTATSVVRWNGADRPTTLVNPVQLDADIPASDIAAAGTAQITVFNPAPGGGLSTPLPLAIVMPPPNDHFANSIVATMSPFSHMVDTRGATIEPTDPAPPCGIGSTAKSVWYSFTLPANATVTVDTVGSNYDTVLSAWTGAPGSLSSVACDDDTIGLQSRLTLTSPMQTTFHFMVSDFLPDGFGGAGGMLVFNLSVDASFSLSNSGAASATVARGQSATFNLTVTPQMVSFPTNVNFSCVSPPFGITCTFNPATVPLGPGPANTTLTVSTSGLAQVAPRGEFASFFALWVLLPIAGLLAAPFVGIRQRAARARFGILLLLLVIMMGAHVGCSAGGGPAQSQPLPPQQFTITVRAASGTVSQQTTVMLTVTR